MTKNQTLDYCIESLKAELEDLALQIQEETGFQTNILDFLSEQYENVLEHLNNLQSLKDGISS